LLGTASCEDASASLTSYTGTAPSNLRNVTVTVTEAGTHVGRSWVTRVRSGSGTSTLVVDHACPFVSA
jgi:hypothetical protein